jgi:hypothetical protein
MSEQGEQGELQVPQRDDVLIYKLSEMSAVDNGPIMMDLSNDEDGGNLHSQRVERMFKSHSKRVEKMFKSHSKRVEKMMKTTLETSVF